MKRICHKDEDEVVGDLLGHVPRAVRMRAHARRFQTMYEIFAELNRVGSSGQPPPQRGPVLLLLGGGMAAGKSTVREIIGHDDFWSKARRPCLQPSCQGALQWYWEPATISAMRLGNGAEAACSCMHYSCCML